MKLLSYLFLGLIIISCSNERNSSEDLTAKRDSLYSDVMKVHDELMVPATTLNLMRNKAEKMMDSVSAKGDTIDNSFYTDLQKAHKNIIQAQSEMRTWMMNFKRKGVSKDEVTEFDAMADTMAIEYLEGEMLKLEELTKSTEKALQADSLVK